MLGASTLEGLLADPEGELKKVLMYHVANGKLMEDDLECGEYLEWGYTEGYYTFLTLAIIF